MKQREIKFRAWVFCEFFELSKRGEWTAKWVMGEVKTIHFAAKKARVMDGSFSTNHDYEIGEYCKIMQFTGLNENAFEETEKNKEIYEGDIVEFIGGERFFVEWNDDTCQWQYSDGSPLNNGERYNTYKAIVGNIYENK